ncbi:glycine hydroxymethyltransferase [Actinomadura madurae]|uniref:Serine hydroxymethyltransferase n=1 Tax=Actinomadura madurae TaxID=1993 RepID=A0A1I5PAD3_9ACTN|nr:serine hydroxymethyltransferase [Actinomadura madurae]SFP31068.1 glycine hydroxymethyltransferase [Actinomadura madurae]
MSGPLTWTLDQADPRVHAVIAAEEERQAATLEMIASENFAPRAVLQAQGSVLTNKYSEGYPGRRYYGGCEHVDVIEQIAIDRARRLFGAEHANVQPHSGAQANAAALSALLAPGGRILGLDLAHGGHLTHGTRMNFSGRLYEAVAYHVSRETGLVDMDEVAALAREHRPGVVIAGWSAYPRHLDFAAFRRIADAAGARLLVDMAHFAGLVAAGLHPSPVPHADVVTATTHKTLGGARGGLILCRAEHARSVDAAVFPGQQGGALNQAIAAKAVGLRLAAAPGFADRQRRAVEGARIIAARLSAPDLAGAGVRVATGGTDVHLVLLDLRDCAAAGGPAGGLAAEERLERAGVTVNRNAVPFDPRPARTPSGLRIGTSALATRGFGAEAFAAVADIIAETLAPGFTAADVPKLRRRTAELAAAHPLYP